MIFCVRATRGLRRMIGSGQVPFLLAERAHLESARSMRAVKDRLGHSLQERCKESEGLRWTRAVEDQSAPIPERDNERAWKDHCARSIVAQPGDEAADAQCPVFAVAGISRRSCSILVSVRQFVQPSYLYRFTHDAKRCQCSLPSLRCVGLVNGTL